jgi:hypothetical protein
MAQGVRRFQVMALLQAARAFRLGLKLDEAKSWGLSRAIFYAAARHGFRRKREQYLSAGNEAEAEERKRVRPGQFYVLGGERANLAAPSSKGELRFQMGGTALSPYDFDRQIKLRFGSQWNQAWNEALRIIDHADPKDLQNQQRFFNSVYKPLRDELAEKYSAPAGAQVIPIQKHKAPRRASKAEGPIRLVPAQKERKTRKERKTKKAA